MLSYIINLEFDNSFCEITQNEIQEIDGGVVMETYHGLK